MNALLALALLAAGLVPGPPSPAAPAAGASCTEVAFNVALAEGWPAEHVVRATRCRPASTTTTLLVLVPGITYSRVYWDLPDLRDGTDRYSFAKAAHRRGFATLAVDRIGTGRSTRPPSMLVTIDTNAHALHQVLQAARTGFDRVVLVAHSYGSWVSWFVGTNHPADADAIVLTGATHKVTTAESMRDRFTLLYPAALDPAFVADIVDPGYMTSRPGKRYDLFNAPAVVDPLLRQFDEDTKTTLTFTEVARFPVTFARPLDLRVPVLLQAGSLDTIFCGPAKGGADCSSGEALKADEGPFLGRRVPRLDAVVLPTAGHDLTTVAEAQVGFAQILDWIQGLPEDTPRAATTTEGP